MTPTKSVSASNNSRSQTRARDLSSNGGTPKKLRKRRKIPNDENGLNLRNLRKFDKLSGGFKDKDFSDQYSISKVDRFLQK